MTLGHGTLGVEGREGYIIIMTHVIVPKQLPQHMRAVKYPYICHEWRRPSSPMPRHCSHRLPLAMAVTLNVAICGDLRERFAQKSKHY